MASRIKNVTDIRLDVEFFEDFRFQKVMRRFGIEGVMGIILLWCYCAKHFPSDSGHFPACFDEEDLLFACKINLDSHDYVEMLLQLDIIGKDDDHFFVCAWDEMQPWAAEARERSKAAKLAAEARWGKKKNKTKQDDTKKEDPSSAGDINGDADAMPTHENKDAPALQNDDLRNAPSPTPTLYVKTPYSPPKGDELVEIFCEILPELSKPKSLTKELMKKVERCGYEFGPDGNGIDWWQWYFEQIRDYPYLLGEVNPEWKASLPWLIEGKNIAKVFGGGFQSREDVEVNGLTSGSGMSEEEFEARCAAGGS
ncbi:hypothetical protein [Maridesulfovibrio ferrireducens]|uniref:hypothetical protein n=1 Tax=Maridesulfovibrio ferrireducens TaxID=246191 RepID=UPI001A27C1CD|nr:hypothetical protein [Maridesulfovibrio ferrireducens]MBI9110342.1 hypothetical protein [Maridesulfovibrio ferrireducens]